MATKLTKRVAGPDKSKAIDRPFDPKILARARAIAWQYRIVLEPDAECGYIGSSLEMPSVYDDGLTADQCVQAVREALTAAVAYLIESGQVPPVPAKDQVRNKQVNIRLTEAEQTRLKEAAKSHGFSDISDYVRSTSLCTQ
jgi:predicted RNase H-like HicB family nuclease